MTDASLHTENKNPDVVVHISDLHFGRGFQHAPAERLTSLINELKPDAVVVSGDLTMRARAGQFADAARYLSALNAPKVIIPGNHDVPLFDVITRTLRPQRNYHRYMDELSTNPLVLRHTGIFGLNTVTRWMHEKGRLRRREVEFALSWMASLPDSHWRLLVTHQQFFNVPESARPGSLLLARRHLTRFSRGGTHAILHGHIHCAHAVQAVEFIRDLPRPIAMVAAGTATCGRMRGSPERRVNSFNILHLSPIELRVTRMDWNREANDFQTGSLVQFPRATFDVAQPAKGSL